MLMFLASKRIFSLESETDVTIIVLTVPMLLSISCSLNDLFDSVVIHFSS